MEIFASLTTLPGREKSCFRMVRSLLAQKPMFDKIVITIPKTYMRLKETYSEGALEKLRVLSPRIHINLVEHDRGPGLKFFGHCKGGFTFVGDDDQIYRKGTLEKLLRRSRRAMKRGCKNHVIQNSKRKQIRGFRGILIPPRVLEGFVDFLEGLPPQTWEIDDDIMEAFLRKKKIPILNPKNFINPKRMFKKSPPPHALGRGNKRRRDNLRKILKSSFGAKRSDDSPVGY